MVLIWVGVGTVVGAVIVVSLVVPLSFASSTRNPPHEQWLMRLGAGAQACPSFGCGSRFVGL